jgi:hypothetical protein
MKNILVASDTIIESIPKLCKVFTFVCKKLIQFFIENTPTNRIDYDRFFNEFSFAPGGTSARNINHWIQFYTQKKFTRFDYGKTENFKNYGQDSAPEYDLTVFKNYKVKSLITQSNKDPFSKSEDLHYLITHLDPDHVRIKTLDNYNHLDYLWSSDAVEDIYFDILKFLSN